MRQEETQGWGKLHYVGLQNLSSSANIIVRIKAVMMILTGHAARMTDV
jgi:hypothetical protein